MSSHQPWMKFYPRDWRGDQALRAVGLSARGLWMECLMLMHEAKPYGHLVVGREPPTDDVLARLVGCSPVEIGPLLAELESAGVFNRTNNGIIYSRRMTSDKRKADKCRNAVNAGRWHKGDSKIAPPNRSPNRAPMETPISQKPDVQNPSLSRDGPGQGFEYECRKRLGSEPILVDRNFSPIQLGLDAGEFTQADVLTGIDAAMATPTFRITYWSQLVGWARKAGQKRLGQGRKAVPVARPAEASEISDDTWRAYLANWRKDPNSWPSGQARAFIGSPPGEAGCKVPPHLIPAAERAA